MSAHPPTRRVRVIEDHDDTREMLLMHLSDCGFEAIGVKSGTEAFVALERDRPNVILLDLAMPNMDGWKFRQEQSALLDRELASIPVIVTSGWAVGGTGPAVSAEAFLTKPYDLKELTATVSRYCSSARYPAPSSR